MTLILTHLESPRILHRFPSHIVVHVFCHIRLLLPHMRSFATHACFFRNACSFATLACSFAADVFCMTYSRFFGYIAFYQPHSCFFCCTRVFRTFSYYTRVLSATLMFFLLQSHFSDFFLASMQFASHCYLPFGFCRKTNVEGRFNA